MLFINNNSAESCTKIHCPQGLHGKIIGATVVATIITVSMTFFAAYKFLQSAMIHFITNKVDVFFQNFNSGEVSDFDQSFIEKFQELLPPVLYRELREQLHDILNNMKMEMYADGELNVTKKNQLLIFVRALLKQHSATIFFGGITYYFAKRSLSHVEQNASDIAVIYPATTPSAQTLYDTIKGNVMEVWHSIFSSE